MTRASAPPGMLPRVVAEATSSEPRATEWVAGAKPSWRKTSTAIAGTAHAMAGQPRPAGARLRNSSTAVNAATAAIQIQALVAVTHANAASVAASAWHIYMMTHHSEAYMKLKEFDDRRKRDFGKAVGKVADNPPIDQAGNIIRVGEEHGSDGFRAARLR